MQSFYSRAVYDNPRRRVRATPSARHQRPHLFSRAQVRWQERMESGRGRITSTATRDQLCRTVLCCLKQSRSESPQVQKAGSERQVKVLSSALMVWAKVYSLHEVAYTLTRLRDHSMHHHHQLLRTPALPPLRPSAVSLQPSRTVGSQQQHCRRCRYLSGWQYLENNQMKG